MKKSRDFDIAFIGLKLGKHEFFYSLEEDDLVDLATENDLKDIRGLVKLNLEKEESFLDLKFQNTLKAKTSCDRCGDDLDMEIWDEFEVILKFSSDPERDNAENDQVDIRFIGRNESKIKLEAIIKEMLALMVPMNIAHAEEDCDPETLRLLETMKPQNPKRNVWKGLDKLKFDK